MTKRCDHCTTETNDLVTARWQDAEGTLHRRLYHVCNECADAAAGVDSPGYHVIRVSVPE